MEILLDLLQLVSVINILDIYDISLKVRRKKKCGTVFFFIVSMKMKRPSEKLYVEKINLIDEDSETESDDQMKITKKKKVTFDIDYEAKTAVHKSVEQISKKDLISKSTHQNLKTCANKP